MASPEGILPEWFSEETAQKVWDSISHGVKNLYEGRSWNSGKKAVPGKMYNDSGEVMDANSDTYRPISRENDALRRIDPNGNNYMPSPSEMRLNKMFMDQPWIQEFNQQGTVDRNRIDPDRGSLQNLDKYRM